ncbi:MAG: DUF3015 family protein, partial [Myxococcaceae bacterium]
SSGSSSFTTAALLPLATTGASIYFLVVKKDDKGTKPNTSTPDAGGGYVMNEAEAERWAELFIRDHSEQLAEDIANGHGPVLNDLATVLRIPASHQAKLGVVLQRDASELLPLVQRNTLNGKKAGQFFTRMGQLMRNDAELNADVAALRG